MSAMPVLRSASGAIHLLKVGDWEQDASGHEQAVLAGCQGPTLDVGCGPGRLVAELGGRGIPSLGIDVAPSALHLARQRGPVLDRSVFDPLPGEGRWREVLLFDGNIGIGGNPGVLLRRIAELLAPDGRALVEVDKPGDGLRTEAVTLEWGDRRSAWFPWSWVGADAIGGLAAGAGLPVAHRLRLGDRWFVWLSR